MNDLDILMATVDQISYETGTYGNDHEGWMNFLEYVNLLRPDLMEPVLGRWRTYFCADKGVRDRLSVLGAVWDSQNCLCGYRRLP